MTFIIGIDQYGQHYDNLGKYPRKELANRLSGKCSKMYIDKKDGSTVHCGYIFGNTWVSLYKLEPIENKA